MNHNSQQIRIGRVTYVSPQRNSKVERKRSSDHFDLYKNIQIAGTSIEEHLKNKFIKGIKR